MQRSLEEKILKQKLAEEKAARVADNYQKRIEDLMRNYHSPKDCGGAMQFLIEKGKEAK
jgi:hypothetical protein